jgi:hypothetical protein
MNVQDALSKALKIGLKSLDFSDQGLEVTILFGSDEHGQEFCEWANSHSVPTYSPEGLARVTVYL